MSAGVAPRPWTTWTARTAAEFAKVLAGYRAHLTQERGLAKPTVAGYLSVARKFFEHLTSSGRHDLSRLDATAVSQFVVRAGQTSCIGTTKQVITGLRSLLRFLHVAGQAPTLAGSVPAVAGWRGSALPKALPPGHVERLLASCDRATASGRHDLAVLTLLARLGLRVGETVRLERGDFDWRHGEVLIRGKADRHERLPLPVDVGEAVAEYILGSSRVEGHGPLFVSSDDPPRALTVQRARALVRAACHRAGIPPVNAHVLRHTAATEMLRAGASLIEVGQVLRHRSLATTAIYAKVDREPLRELARPWPVTSR